MNVHSQHFLSVRFKKSQHNPEGVYFIEVNSEHPDRFYWSGGQTWASMEYEIVQDWGIIKTDKAIDQAEIDHLKKYHPIEPAKELVASGGWIAPNGDFYPCKSWQHDSIATLITAKLYNDLTGTKLLEKNSWIRLYDEGFIGFEGKDFTQKQRDTFADLAALSTEERWRSSMIANSKREFR